MKNFDLVATLGSILFLSQSLFAADRVLTCAVNDVKPLTGIRVNIIFSQNKLKATVFEGTTMNSSGTYWIKRTRDGFVGTDRTGQRDFSILVGTVASENAYIKGVRAVLQHAVIETSQGNKVLSTKPSENLVCGVQIKPYR